MQNNEKESEEIYEFQRTFVDDRWFEDRLESYPYYEQEQQQQQQEQDQQQQHQNQQQQQQQQNQQQQSNYNFSVDQQYLDEPNYLHLLPESKLKIPLSPQYQYQEQYDEPYSLFRQNTNQDNINNNSQFIDPISNYHQTRLSSNQEYNHNQYYFNTNNNNDNNLFLDDDNNQFLNEQFNQSQNQIFIDQQQQQQPQQQQQQQLLLQSQTYNNNTNLEDIQTINNPIDIKEQNNNNKQIQIENYQEIIQIIEPKQDKTIQEQQQEQHQQNQQQSQIQPDQLQNQSQNQNQNQLELVEIQSQYKKVNFNIKIFEPQYNLPEQKRYYLYVDQVIDINYLKNYKKNKDYINSNDSLRHYQGLRFISSITHRMDNKYIEVQMHSYETRLENIDLVLHLIKSYNNSDLYEFLKDITDFKEGIILTQKSIQEQYNNPIFQQHQKQRDIQRNILFQNLTAQQDQQKFLFYQLLSVNYENNKVESTIAGFSPSLYELLGIDSYSFKEYIHKNGYMCPLFQRLDKCFAGACGYLKAPPKNRYVNSLRSIDTMIVTSDNFKFPTRLTATRYNLNEEYDNLNGLDLNWSDTLNVYEFVFEDIEPIQHFFKFREEQKYQKSQPLETIYNNTDDIDLQKFDFKDTQFFDKYYCDQIDNLLKKGNKWFKRCGYMDIPQKRRKNKKNNNNDDCN